MSDPDNDLEGSSSPASYTYHSSSFLESTTNSCSPSTRDASPNPTTTAASRKKSRQMANDNERRRMQTINEGFRALSECLQNNSSNPDRKMSKANILKMTVTYIKNVEAKYREIRETLLRSQPASITVNDNTAEYEKQIAELKQALEKEHKLRLAYESEVIQMRMQVCNVQVGLPGAYVPTTSMKTNMLSPFGQTTSTTSPFFFTGVI